MAESLRRLVNIGTFSVLQDKLERWLDNYHINTCDQNVARCCEIIELNAKVQGQLFKLLSVTAQLGGMYGGASVIKSRLLPFLGSQYFALTGGALTADTSLSILASAAEKDREMNQLQDQYETDIQGLEVDLKSRENEVQDLRDELLDCKDELARNLRNSTSDKMFLETENRELRRKLIDAQDEICKLRARSGLVDDYERQVRNLKDELSLASIKKSYLDGDLNSSLTSYRFLSRGKSVLSEDDPVQRVRQQNLVSRWNDLFSQDRLDAMDTLRRYCDDYENNQRIIFSALQESFSTAKQAFRTFKSKVRANLAISHIGPEPLEEAVQDYINRNTDLYDLPGMVADVLRGLNRNPKIFLPPDGTFAIIQPFVREACKLAWQMTALAHPLDISIATDAELFEHNKYRRSYDSEYTAPLVNHHIWPALAQGVKVLMKGECCTRRGASLGSSRRSRSRSRSISPSIRTRSRSRSLSPVRFARSRSRSPSPRRIAGQYKTDEIY